MLKVRIQNFQSMSDTSFTVEGFTGLWGTNNLGKSAVIRSIKCMFSNTRGSWFVRHGEEQACVEVSDGETSVFWEKGGGGARYKVGDEDFQKVKSSVPDKVLEFGIREVVCAGDSLWPQIASQFTDPLFLVNKPGSVLAEALADVVRISSLSNASAMVKKDHKKELSRIELRTQEVAEIEDLLKGFEGVEELQGDLDELSRKWTEMNKISRALERLSEWEDDRVFLKDRIRMLEEHELELPPEPDPSKVFSILYFLSDLREGIREAREEATRRKSVLDLELPGIPAEVKELSDELDEMSRLDSSYQELRASLRAYESLQLSEANAELEGFQESLEDFQKGLDEYDELSGYLEGIVEVSAELDKQTGAVRKLESVLQGLEKDIKDLEEELGVCPLCGSSFSG